MAKDTSGTPKQDRRRDSPITAAVDGFLPIYSGALANIGGPQDSKHLLPRLDLFLVPG